MKTYLPIAILAVLLISIPTTNYSQAPPLGTTNSFALFTAAGAFSNDGATVVTGDIGTNVGAFTGFPPGIVIGQIHVADVVSAQAASDVAIAYSSLAVVTCGIVLGTTLGSGQILTPNVYCLGAASTLNGELILDGQGDPNAIFIFKIDGAFSTTSLSSVTLINSASICNVFWQVNGEFILGPSSEFKGTVINNGAITLLEGSSLMGRALSIAGAIALHNNIVTISLSCTTLLISCPLDISIECNESTLPANTGTVTVTDDCEPSPSITYSDVITPGTCLQEYLITREWTVLDTCGNISICVQLINVTDTTGPVITCPVVTSPIECGQSPLFGTATATDACNPSVEITFTTDSISGSCGLNYSLTRTWTATDDCGNTSTCSATITVDDSTPPLLVCPVVSSPIECGQSPLFGTATATDACDPSVEITFTTDSISGGCGLTYSLTRTWTATDDCGNTATCSATLVINDTTVPLIICPTVSTPIQCGSPIIFGEATATDACDPSVEITFVTDSIPGGCGQEYSLTRTWTATDDCGNTSTCSAAIFVEDTMAPVIICPLVESPVQCGSPFAFGMATAVDACDPFVDITFTDVTDAGGCPLFSVTRTWVATDDCGNTASCSATIIFEETTPPVITCPIVVSPVECGTPLTFGIASATDACDASVEISFSDVTAPGSCPQEYSVTRTWIATDDCGNSSSCSVTIEVQDNIAPILTCPTVVSPIECGSIPVFGIATAIDACDATIDLVFSEVTTPGSCLQEYSVTRTWIATDDCGNSSSCSATINVEDNTAPIITCPIVVSPIECGFVPLFGDPTVLDACDVDVDILFSDLVTPGSCLQEYSVTRTWTATDDCGNSSSCSATINVEDNTAPLITCPTVASPIECGSVPLFGDPTVLDACDVNVDIQFSDLITPGSCPQEYSVTRTWIATDDCGNTASCNATIIIEDNTAPIITCPIVVSPIECGSQPLFGDPTILDACDVDVDIQFSDLVTPGSCPQEYSVTRTWIATDDCGNSASCSAATVVEDNTAPIIICPIVVSPIECGSVPLFGDPTVMDACDVEVDIQFSDLVTPGSCPQEYSVTRTWTATDDCGNSSSCSATINVEDNTAPIITCPIVVSPIECGSIPIFGDPTVLDACDIDVDIQFSDLVTPGSCPQEYSVTRTWIATDDCGNSSLCSATINVEDNTAPIITCPIVVSPIECGSVPLFGDPVVLDACDVNVDIQFSDLVTPGSCLQEYSVTRTWIATDDCGNSASCSATIVIEDNTAPIVTCPIVVSPIECENVPVFGDPTVLDACDVEVDILFSDLVTPGSCPQEYSVTRTWTATDDCGNSTSCSATIVVEDNTAPIITCPIVVSPIECGNVPVFGDPTVLDACDADVDILFSDLVTLGSCPQEYSVTRTWTATDDCGNSSSCSATINVEDNTAPIITCPIVVSPIECGSIPIFGDPTVLDACDIDVDIQFSDLVTPGSCPQEYSVTRTWIAIDDCGNSSSCSATIMVEDIAPPIITCPIVVSPIECGNVPVFGNPTVLDACDVAVDIQFSDLVTPGSCPQEYNVTRTWIATDDCGNSASCSATIEVQDNTAPVITCPTVVSPIECDITPNFGVVTAIDACDTEVTILFTDLITPGSCLQEYSVTRTWTATDDCGNSSFCSSTIIVEDNTPPEFIILNPLLEVDTLFVQCYGQDPGWDIPEFDEGSVAALDLCSGPASVTFGQILEDAGDCEVDGYINLYRLTWTASDLCGNDTSLVVYMALVDTIAPVIFGVPFDISVNCDSIPPPPVLVYAIDECLCACIVFFEEYEQDLQGGCQDGRVLLRTWTAKDRCGNMTVDTQAITLIDDQGPVLQLLHPELSLLTDGSILEYTCIEGGIPEFYDLLDETSITSPATCGGSALITFDNQTVVSTNCEFFGYVEQRTFHWTGVDLCGNTTHLSIMVRLIDTEEPVLTGVPDMTCIGDPALRNVEATDNCGEANVRFWDVPISNPCGDGMAIRRTYEAYDECGNMSRDTAILIPNDLIAPDMEFIDPVMFGTLSGESIIVNCSGERGGKYTSFGPEDIVAGSGCGSTTVTFSENLISEGNCETDGFVAIVELKWTITDFCGNSSEHIILATVIDESSPVFINFSPVMTIGCNDSLPEIQVIDNCGEVILVVQDSIVAGECESEYNVIRLITVSDLCGNSNTTIQTIHVGDGGGPVINGVIEEVCEDLVIPVVTAFDACAGEFVEVMMHQDTIDSTCHDGLVIERTWSAVDGCGHVSVIRQTIILNDVIPPVIMLPSYSVIQLFVDQENNKVLLSQVDMVSRLDALFEGSVIVLDECDEWIVPVFTVDTTYAPDCEVDGYYQLRKYTWAATDVCGNTDSVSFSVYIVDDLAPEFVSFPNDTTIICAPMPPVPNVVVTDLALPLDVVYTEVITNGETTGYFILTRTWVATDACGNTAKGVQHITWIPDTFLECEIPQPEPIECNSHGVLILSNVLGGTGPMTYEWEIVGEKCFIQGGQGTPELLIYMGWSEVKIILTVTDSFGCVSMCMMFLDCLDPSEMSLVDIPEFLDLDEEADAVVPEIILGSPDHQGGSIRNISLWPIPAKGMVNLSFESVGEEEVKFSFYNLLGSVVLTDKVNAVKGINNQSFDVSNLQPGSYLLQIQSQKEIQLKVVVILGKE